MKFLVSFFLLVFLSFSYAQEPNINIQGKVDTTKTVATDPFKASLYSAILPGWGQVYNKQYWKIPIVWGAIGGGIGFIFYYNRRYKDYRNGYLASLNGDPTGYPDNYTTEILATAQDDARRDRDYAIAITTLLYAMNVIDAIVSAHLSEMKDDKDLAFRPAILTNPEMTKAYAGLGFRINF